MCCLYPKENSIPLFLMEPIFDGTALYPTYIGANGVAIMSLVVFWNIFREASTRLLNREKSKPILNVSVLSHLISLLASSAG